MTLNEVMEFERANEVVKAADSYEIILKECSGNLNAYINLLVLYWQSTDYGFSSSNGLSPDFVRVAGNRLAEMLNGSLSNFYDEPEFQFWAKYIAWAELGEKFDIEECYGLMRRKLRYYEPAMFIYASTAGKQAVSEVAELLALVQSQQTIRDRYINSVVMGIRCE
ncbi:MULTISPECIES: hypothetical protein [Xanthomonas]|uniref:Immunity protein 30 domain-containing protein n=1 Tax=Xanthomonas dyei TaxID=743699 RepID=A0ABZ0DEK1_9XANT|nr:hypothetical protein [Xanthomonas dyei]WOB26886.1 hypothetical protein NYR99_02520 [Xanthomonas dyei]WOB54506.1 hypothetical protein NYR95_02525 [Xanthomonas dyei]